MGMDMYLFTAHSKKELEDPNFWSKEEHDDPFSSAGKVYYSRKFWDLYNNLSFTSHYECGTWMSLTKDQVEEMLDFSCHNRDYFDGFNTVIQLCEILAHWKEIEENGLKIFFECDW